MKKLKPSVKSSRLGTTRARSLALNVLAIQDFFMGYVFGQRDETDRKEQAIYYLTKKFTEYVSIFRPREDLLLPTYCALIWATQRLRHYMMCHTTLLIFQMDLLKYLFEKLVLSRRHAIRHLLSTEFDITFITQKSIKGQLIADHLAENPIENYNPMADFLYGRIHPEHRSRGGAS